MLTIPIDTTGIDPRTAEELELILTRIQAWANRGQQEFQGSASFVQPRCRHFLPTAQSIPNNTDTRVQFQPYGSAFPASTLLFDVHYDNGASFGRPFLQGTQYYFVPPVAGQYLIVAGTSFVANATGERHLWLTVDQHNAAAGTTTTFELEGVNSVANSGTYSTRLQVQSILTAIDPKVGETRLSLYVFQDSGGNLNIQQGYAGTYLTALKVS